jgi:hypothetical protein
MEYYGCGVMLIQTGNDFGPEQTFKFAESVADAASELRFAYYLIKSVNLMNFTNKNVHESF